MTEPLTLSRGEKILWTGAPPRGLLFQSADVFVVPFTLLWAGMAFSIFSQTSRTGGTFPFPFSIVRLFFVLIGVYVTVGRFVVDVLARRRTSYVVTSQRIAIVSGLAARTVTSLALGTLTDVRLTERGTDTGTITFGAVNPWYMTGGRNWPGMRQGTMFERIPSARAVYDIITAAQRAASSPAHP